MSTFPAPAWIESLDRSLLHWINCDLHAPWLQDVLFFLQAKTVGVPIVLVLIAVSGGLRGWQVMLRTLLTCGLAFLVGWQVAELMWTTIGRERPPRVLETVLRTPEEISTCAAHPESVSVRKYVSRRPGLPSQHALHSAAFACALFLAVRWIGALAFLYAVLVASARVMMGTHWPSDVLAGLALGPLIAWGLWWCLPRLFGLFGRAAWVTAPDVQGVSEGTSEATADRG